METDGSSALTAQHLVKIYNPDRPELAVRAVDDVSFTVERGESVAIVGPSGGGKSTLMYMLGCLSRPTSGSYFIDGRDVARLGDDALAEVRNRHIGFVFQAANLLPRRTAVENVMLPLAYAGARGARERALEALERVGLAQRAAHRPNELSGGQLQRVAIARALVTRPSLLLCDEPTGALDSRTGREILDLLEALNREGTTLLMVTHDAAVARRMRRALRIGDGKLEADGPTGEVLDGAPARASDAGGG
ncbi:MAG: ABC transporter ATP-binding protein [Deltaproteobacteria bacterium]|nr:ABC transporter ATP-binding protein [Deltaproteobacteria bacterium]